MFDRQIHHFVQVLVEDVYLRQLLVDSRFMDGDARGSAESRFGSDRWDAGSCAQTAAWHSLPLRLAWVWYGTHYWALLWKK